MPREILPKLAERGVQGVQSGPMPPKPAFAALVE
jgi:hypothetical protein